MKSSELLYALAASLLCLAAPIAGAAEKLFTDTFGVDKSELSSVGTNRLRIERPPKTKVVLCLHPSGHHSLLAASNSHFGGGALACSRLWTRKRRVRSSFSNDSSRLQIGAPSKLELLAGRRP